MNALFSAASQATDVEYRDRAPRAATLLVTGKLILHDRECLCRVRNLSASGAMIEARTALHEGQEVRIAMRRGGEISARVAWARDGAAGLAFLSPIDVVAVLNEQAPRSRIARQRPARAPRLAATCAIEVEARGGAHPAALLDISQRGARLRVPFRPVQDERLALSIPGLPLKCGAVRWISGAEVGVCFYEALPFDVLATWIEARAQASET